MTPTPDEERDLLETIESLPAAEAAKLRAWIRTGIFIADGLGLSREEWFSYLAWAFENPLNLDFVGDDASSLEEWIGLGDGVESQASLRRAVTTVGRTEPVKKPGTGRPGNLLQMVTTGSKERQDRSKKS